MVSNTNTFHVYGATLRLPDGDITLVAGNNITITPAFGSLTIAAIVPPGGSSTSGFVPYSGATSNVDLNNKNLTNVDNFGLNGDIDFSADGLLRGNVLSLGSTTFHGAGLNDLTFTGLYTGNGTPTYRFTVTDLDTQHLSVDDASNIFVGDSIIGNDTGSTGTVLSSDGSTEIILGSITGDFSTDTSITDTTTSATANVYQADAKVDLGTFTDGTTTLTLQAIRGRTGLLQGITYSAAAYTGHTTTDYWEANISQVLADGLSLGFSDDTFSLGDSEQKRYGNEYLTDIHSGETRWQLRDKSNVWMSMGGDAQGHRPTFKGLGGSGAGRFVGLDNNGLMANVVSPLAIGTAVGGSSNNNFYLFSNGSGNLAQGSVASGGIQKTGSGLTLYVDAFNINDIANNVFYQFDLGPGKTIKLGDITGIAGSSAINNFNLITGDINYQTNATFKLKNVAGTDFLNIDIGGGHALSAGMDWDFGSNQLHSVTDPTSAQDAATKNYVDTRSIAGSKTATGTATTVFTVTIGVTMPSAAYAADVTPTNALSAAPFYVTNKTTATFDVVYLTGLTGAVAFDWIVHN